MNAAVCDLQIAAFYFVYLPCKKLLSVVLGDMK